MTWDWNSPQSKKIPKKSQKRLALTVPHTPKKTLKRHISSNSFEKIQEELRLLKEQIAIPEHEESLVLSPIEEAEYKNNENNSINNIDLENFINETEDFFNDSFDEQLLVCTTQMESQLIEVTATSLLCNNENNLNYKSVDKKLEDTKMKYQDNFNVLEKNIHLEETYQNNNLQPKDNKSNNTVPRFGKVEFHRTQSFEISTENLVGKTKSNPNYSVLQNQLYFIY